MPTERMIPRRAAAYRDVFAVREFRALFAAHLLSLIGDQLARVSVSVLVFDDTDSALLAAIAFGIGYLPWVAIGPVLTAMTDRLPRRTVMITCDVVQAALVASLIVPGLPLAAMVAVLFCSALCAPPAQSARSATMPEVLDGDKYVVGTSIGILSDQVAQLLGFAAGGVLIGVLSPRGVLALDAMTFAVSALLLARFVVNRRPAERTTRTTVWQDTVDGARLVMGDKDLRAFVMLAWIGAAFTAAPEGLMIAYAHFLGGGSATAGLLLAAMPLGAVIGTIFYGRFTPPARRWRRVRAMAFLSCLALVPMICSPPLPVVLALLIVVGYGSAYQVALNAQFVKAVPASHRGRAIGVAVAGLMLGTGGATAVNGLLADLWNDPPLVVGLCGLCGLVAMLPVLLRWPRTG